MSAWWDLTPVEGQDEQTDQLIERYAQMEEDYNFEWEYVMVPGKTIRGPISRTPWPVTRLPISP